MWLWRYIGNQVYMPLDRTLNPKNTYLHWMLQIDLHEGSTASLDRHSLPLDVHQCETRTQTQGSSSSHIDIGTLQPPGYNIIRNHTKPSCQGHIIRLVMIQLE